MKTNRYIEHQADKKKKKKKKKKKNIETPP